MSTMIIRLIPRKLHLIRLFRPRLSLHGKLSDKEFHSEALKRHQIMRHVVVMKISQRRGKIWPAISM